MEESEESGRNTEIGNGGICCGKFCTTEATAMMSRLEVERRFPSVVAPLVPPSMAAARHRTQKILQ